MEVESQNKIAPQRFNLIIVACIVSIVLSYADLFLGVEYKDIARLLYGILAVIILWSFKKYLQNFYAAKAIYWLKWNLAIAILLFVSMYMQGRLYYAKWLEDHSSIGPSADSLKHRPPAYAFLTLFILLLFIPFIISNVKFGNSLRKIENDFIGLLKKLGLSLTYLLIIAVVCMVAILLISKTFAHSFIFKIILNTMLIIPTIILTMIFYRAKKYQAVN